MSEFNYKDFLKNSSFLNEAEEKEEDKVSEDRIEKAIKAVLKKEGGAAGVKPLVDAAKELGASKKDLMDVLEKMKSVKTHKHGDIIDTDGLNEAAGENLELKSLQKKAYSVLKGMGFTPRLTSGEVMAGKTILSKQTYKANRGPAIVNLDPKTGILDILITSDSLQRNPNQDFSVDKSIDSDQEANKVVVELEKLIDKNKFEVGYEQTRDRGGSIYQIFVRAKATGKKGGLAATEGLKEEEENLEEAEESVLSNEKKMVMKLLLGKMQDIENANPEELTRDFLMKTKNMIDDLMISDF